MITQERHSSEGNKLWVTKVNSGGWWFLNFNDSYPVDNQKLNLFIVSDVKTLEVQRVWQVESEY